MLYVDTRSTQASVYRIYGGRSSGATQRGNGVPNGYGAYRFTVARLPFWTLFFALACRSAIRDGLIGLGLVIFQGVAQ
ncbi:hypothetical protein CIW54_08965 [Paraburkholderia sp. T12-10]|nr:hypothetical protein CIW54_08965 [Paraburkholderia sp. T12-10]